MADYKHGTYGEFAESIGGVGTQGSTVAVYIGAAPVNLVRGYAKYVNAPVKLSNFSAARRYMGYSSDWANFDLCEAMSTHLDNAAGNAGPIVVINVLDPATHKKQTQTTKELTFTNGRATFESDKVVLDTLVLADKVEGTDFSIDYDFTRGQVILTSMKTGEDAIDGKINATFDEVDPAAITAEDIIGGVTAAGVYTGLGCIDLIYQELGLIPNLILCPKWSSTPDVYNAMIKAGTKINGHWDAFIYADIPVLDGSAKVDTIEAAIAWRTTNGYNNERSKVFWPQNLDALSEKIDTDNDEVADTTTRIHHASVLAAWRTLLIDATHDGLPMETCSNKAVPVVSHYFGEGSTNRGFDQTRANELNAAGITTTVYWGGQWVLWGPHSAAFKHGSVTDNRNIFDVSIRMMMHVSNSFQQEHALVIDSPMTRAMADTIRMREQEKLDAWAAMGAFIGTPVCLFLEEDNSTDDLVEGSFTWYSKGTTTPPFKDGTIRVAYTTEGFNTYFEEVA